MAPEPKRIIDAHIHLWPASSANPAGHGWMQPGHHLTRQYSIDDYLSSSSSSHPPDGFVYVETDRFLPPVPANAADDDTFLRYIHEPLSEIAFLRRVAEGRPLEGEGHAAEHAKLMKGVVAWAPVHMGRSGLERYFREAERVGGEQLWGLVKGFRVLLQGIRDEKSLRDLVFGQEWMEGLKELGSKGFSFDVGVDQRQGGVWQLEIAGEMAKKLRDEGGETILILNHLCKPDMEGQLQTADQKADFDRWCAAIEGMSKLTGVYMKLSGAFSELGDQEPAHPWSTEYIVERMTPWLDVIFRLFPPSRIMFGSDWPVCCVRGPGDALSWESWKDVVSSVLEKYRLTDEEKDRVWYGTAVEAYGLAVQWKQA